MFVQFQALYTRTCGKNCNFSEICHHIQGYFCMLFRSNIWHRQLAGEYLCVKVSNKACQVFIAEWRSYLVKLLDGNCMCHVGKVQRLFISGQLKYIMLFVIRSLCFASSLEEWCFSSLVPRRGG